MQNPYANNPSLAAKWEAAVTYLGTKWIVHPQSTYKPSWFATKG